MSNPIALSGMASGLDTEAIISQLMSVEQQPKTRMALADTQAKSRQDTLRDMATKIGAVRNAATALRSVTTWTNVQTVTSGDPTKLSARAGGSSPPGSHTVAVSQLATKAQHAFAYTASASPQTIKIGTDFTLNVDANANVATVASAINDRADAPVSAVVADGKLFLTSRKTGTAADLPVDAAALLAEDMTYARPGVDAKYAIDGNPEVTSASNVVTNLGVELTLKATTAGTTFDVGDPGLDSDGVKAKVKTFVNAYNAAVDFIRGELTEKPVKDPTTNSDALKGLFFGDTMLSGVLSSMRSQIGDLSNFGISTGASTGSATVSSDAIAGRLTVNDTKLTTALAGDQATLRTALTGTGQRMSTALATSAAGARVDARISSVDATRKRLATDMTAVDVRLADKEKRLRAQFAAMEAALAASQAAQSQLTAQLKGL
jgi:flagellar hook-associated protein 2